jgi:hypothetical protein
MPAVVCGCWLIAQAPAASAADPEPAATGAQAAAVELPHFKPGLWEFRRTVMSGQSSQPQVSTVRKCTDPSADIRSKMSMLKTKNCEFTPLSKKQEHYLSSWNCPTPHGAMRFRDVLTVKDLTSYQDVSEVHTAQGVTQQKIEATRVGDCPKARTAPQSPSG